MRRARYEAAELRRPAGAEGTAAAPAGTSTPPAPAVDRERYKRPFDLALVALALIALFPLWAAVGASIALAIRLGDGGPVLFTQRRLGRGGRVFDRYCVGAGCETVRSEANTGFVEATTRLNMALELGGEEFDRQDMRFFTGQRRRCHIHFGGLANCCKNSGLLVGLANCSAEEIELAEERNAGNTHYLGRYCSRRTFFGLCIRHSRAWCVFGSKLGRILQQQGRAQLGIGWSDCRGLTVAEIEGIDFARLDLSEFTENLMDGSMEPTVSLPDAGDTGAAMRTRIREFYGQGQ